MTDFARYRFEIEAYTPATIPMARLADYLVDLAAILGETEHVHFEAVESGSTVVVSRIDADALPNVRARVTSVGRRDGPYEAMRAYQRINRRLAEDGASASLGEWGSDEIVAFAGIKDTSRVTYDAFNQDGSLDGVLIRIGGRQDLVPVHLQCEHQPFSKCLVRKALARDMAHHLFGAPLRVHGEGRWRRDRHGAWELERFTIARFEVLDDAPLSTVVKRLRAAGGWTSIDDPVAELIDIRRGPDETV